jgi:ubiquinone/menaquinone biosynthesis C-methylase UbiE
MLESLYRHRFSDLDAARKKATWAVLCRDFFQRWVRETDTVVDIGCGMGEFIGHIKAARKLGVDANPENRDRLPAGVTFVHASATDLGVMPDATADVAFMSNFLEHLVTKEEVLRALREARRVLKPGGRLLLLQPNIRYAFREYWDFFDHHTALSHLSAVEALQLAGFHPDLVVPRFLPYTTKSLLPQHPALVALYLRVPLAWRVLGKQFFIVARATG